MKPNADWTVLPHGRIEKLAENLFTVVGKLPMPFGETMRRMTIVKLTEGRAAIYSAMCLDAVQMQRLEHLCGEPEFLIVPSAIHRLDIKPWKDRYPALTVVAPPGARDEVSEIVTVDATACDLRDPRVAIGAVPGTGGRELSMLVETPTGKTLVVNDLIFNLPRMGGIAGLGLRVLGFRPGKPTIPPIVRKKLVDDDRAMRAQLREWAQLPGLERILVSHGAPIEKPRDALLDLAAA